MKQTELKRKKPLRHKPKKRTRRKPDKDNPHSKYWRGKADTLWSKVIRLPGKCLLCPRTENLQAHHMIHKSAVFYRHRLENGACLCPKCHTISLDCSAHGSPWAFEIRMEAEFYKQWAWWQDNRWKVTTGIKMDYRDICQDLQAILDKGKAFRWACRKLGVTPEEEA